MRVGSKFQRASISTLRTGIFKAIYVLISSAKLKGLKPDAYLRNVLKRVADHPINRMEKLSPWNVAPEPAPNSLQAAQSTRRSRRPIADACATSVPFVDKPTSKREADASEPFRPAETETSRDDDLYLVLPRNRDF
jgi:transposase IS66-like protein